MESKTLKLKSALLLLTLTIFVFLIQSCSETSEPVKNSITGVIILDNDTGDPGYDPVDYANITISLYPLAVVDTTIVRLNNRYPSIGIIANQQTEFDHRLSNPLISTTTDANGSFFLDSINEGVYNLVVLKPGWGYRYLLNLQVVSGNNTLLGDAGSGNTFLYPEKAVSGYITSGNILVRKNHHLVVEDNLYLLEGSSLTLAAGAVVRVNPGKIIEVNGYLSIKGLADSLVSIVSNDQVFTTAKNNPLSFDRIVINASSTIEGNSIDGIDVKQLEFGFLLKRSCTIQNSSIKGNSEVLIATGTTSDLLQIDIMNCILDLAATSPNYCINLAQISSADVKKSIILGNKGISCTASNSLNILDNYIKTTNYSIYVYQYVEQVNITHNDIISSNQAVWTFWGITSEIKYNNITANVGLRYTSYLNIGVANFNNLYCNTYAIDFSTVSPYLGHLPAQNNWYNTTDDEQVQLLIRDKNDYPPTTQNYDYFSYVDYLPFRTSRVVNAGISN